MICNSTYHKGILPVLLLLTELVKKLIKKRQLIIARTSTYYNVG